SHLQIDINFDKNSDIPKMVTELKELEELERELSMAQRWVQGRIADIQSTLSEEFGADNGQIYTQILESLSDGPKEAETLIEEKDLPEPVVYNAIGNLQERGLIHKTDRGWQLG
ncbi:MAG: MarR family transcriptional regulator, partial [Halobacteriaceae archaeon]